MSGRSTALLARHEELGARLTGFGGWQMPLQYEGIVAEHRSVRDHAGVFDVSHLGKLRLSGPAAEGALQRALTADVASLAPGAARYSLVLTAGGGCIDDVFIYRLADADWLCVPNASNVEAVAAAIEDCGGEPHDEWDRYSILALQGPESFAIFEKVFGGGDALSLKLHRFLPMDFHGESGWVARTGYTGERGFELYVPTAAALRVFDDLLEAGAVPAGLGARDTLRLEMGYALYGHEISLDINPLEAGLGWTIAWDTDFVGREALLPVRESGPARRLFGIRCTDRGVPRQGYRVVRDEREVGAVTSGNFSPTLSTGIALALGPADAVPAPGEAVAIEARGRAVAGVIVEPPFVQRGVKK